MKKTSFWKKNRSFTIFAGLAIVIILVAVLAPVLAPYDPAASVLTDALQAPSGEHLFGTDKLGRDIFSRILYGARVSLSSTIFVVALIFAIGTVLGVLAGYFGGVLDAVIMRLADMMIAFPGMVLAIAVAGIMGASIRNAVIAVALVSWPKYARLARSLVLKIKNCDYIAAAKVNGGKTIHILYRHLLPNALPTLIVTAATDIGGMMLELAGLSFLGFGAQAPTAEWGLMLSEGRQYMQSAPWMIIFPGLAICIVVAVFNLLGDALRDVLDPRND